MVQAKCWRIEKDLRDEFGTSKVLTPRYVIGDRSTGKAVVVDPQRDISEYLEIAKAENLKYDLVLETHFHADFLSGHLELSNATGAEVAYGPSAKPAFPFRSLKDHEEIVLGDHVVLEVLHTPGHTLESVSYLVKVDGKHISVLTGDCLFVGDVGRPDLLGALGITTDELARKLYHSLHEVLMKLDDEVIVYPGHGAGSACGKAMLDAPSTTIGEQKAFNYALRDMSEDKFVEVVTEGLSTPPKYFLHTALANRADHAKMDDHKSPPALTFAEVQKLLAEDKDAVLLDVREVNDVSSSHLSGSLCVPLNSKFAGYAGAITSPDQKVIIVGDLGTELESKNRLGRIGFDNVIGYLSDPIEKVLLENPSLSAEMKRVEPQDFNKWKDEAVAIVDCREPGEFTEGAIPGAINIPLSQIRNVDTWKDKLPKKDGLTVLYCLSGTRSTSELSFMAKQGYSNLCQMTGGYEAWTPTQQ